MTEEQQNIHKLAIATDIYIQLVDAIEDDANDHMKSIVKDLQAVQNKMIPIIDEIFENEYMRQSTFHQEVNNGFHYSFEGQLQRLNKQVKKQIKKKTKV